MTDPVTGGGGAPIDEGAHAFDLLHWLVGDIRSVCSATANLDKPRLRVEDNAMTLVQFQNLAIGSAYWEPLSDRSWPIRPSICHSLSG
jgi:predicted dehydrogenase